MSLIKKIHDHGYMRYCYGCRCDICKNANALYSKTYREKRKKGENIRELKTYKHGDVGKYQFGCRCNECSHASYFYHKDLRERKKKMKDSLQSSDLFDSIK